MLVRTTLVRTTLLRTTLVVRSRGVGIVIGHSLQIILSASSFASSLIKLSGRAKRGAGDALDLRSPSRA